MNSNHRVIIHGFIKLYDLFSHITQTGFPEEDFLEYIVFDTNRRTSLKIIKKRGSRTKSS